MKLLKIFIALSLSFSSHIQAFDRHELMADFKILEKELKTIVKEQYAHESSESDKVSDNPGYVPNNLLPDVKLSMIDLLGRIIAFRSAVLLDADSGKNCVAAMANYQENSLPVFKAAYSDYVENTSTLFVGVQAVIMANSIDGAAFISGPALECGK